MMRAGDFCCLNRMFAEGVTILSLLQESKEIPSAAHAARTRVVGFVPFSSLRTFH